MLILVLALVLVSAVTGAFAGPTDQPSVNNLVENSPFGITAAEITSDGILTTAIQKSLASLGYNPGPIDGIFGPKTKNALREFQKSQGLAADGIINSQTIMVFIKTGSGNKNFMIVFVQKRLTDLGYDPGPTDGILGPKTRKALMRFQIRNRLLPIGIIDPKTIRSLLDFSDRGSRVN